MDLDEALRATESGVCGPYTGEGTAMSVTHSAAWVQGSTIRGEVESLAGSARLRPVPPWELAVENRSAFAEGLNQLGMSATDRDAALRLRDDVSGEIRTLDDDYAAIARASFPPAPALDAIAIAEQRRRAYQRLSAWFTERHFEVRHRAAAELRIPLFVVGAPDVAGCRSEITPTGKPANALSVRFTLHGIGGGASGHAIVTDRVRAAPGATTAVFVPVKVAVDEVVVHDDGRSIAHGPQIALAGAPCASGPAAMWLPADATPTVGEPLHTYLHRGDLAGQVFAYERRMGCGYAETRDLRFGIAMGGLEATVTVGVALAGPVTVATKLVGGHDFDLHETAQGYGVVWRTR
jgi:hypothetical protein